MGLGLDDRIAAALSGSLGEGSLVFAASAALAGGLLTALTPCVYPLIAITLRYFGGLEGGARVRPLALAYVGGMMLLYTVLGTSFAALGLVFGSFLGNAWFTGGMAAFTAAMGASTLGAFTLQLPAAVSTRLSQVGGQTLPGAVGMGLVSGLIAAPCTGPVLAVILAIIAQSGSPGFGFVLMLAFSLGLGLPFLVLALSAGSLSKLPRGGPWMELVKVALAVLMFVVAAYFTSLAWPAAGRALRAVPHVAQVGTVAVGLGLVAAVLLVRSRTPWRSRAAKAVSVFGLTLGAALPVLGGGAVAADSAAQRTTAVSATKIVWSSDHEASWQRARALGQPLMIDFTADWCAACEELERHTFSDARIVAEARRFITVRVDATLVDDRIEALFKRYGVMGLPTVAFVDSGGTQLVTPRVTGFLPADRFVELLKAVR